MATALVSLATTNSPVRAAEWSATPHARLGVEFVNNPVLTARDNPLYYSGTTDFTSDLNADVAKHGDDYDFSISPRLLFIDYTDQSLLDQNDQYVTLNSNLRSERTTWSASANGARDTTLTSELGLTGLTNTNRRHENLQLTLGPTVQYTERLSFSAQASWLTHHYENAGNTGLVDYHYGAADLRSSYALTELTSLALDLSAGQVAAPDAGSRSNNYAVEASLTRQLNEFWLATLSAGPSWVKTAIATQAGAVYDVALQHQGELLRLNAEASRTVTPTGRGLLTTRNQLTLTASRPFTERFTANLSGILSHTRDYTNAVNATPYTVHYYSALASLQWRLAPTWSLSLDLEDRRQTIPSASGNNNAAEGYRANLGIVWTAFPQRL
jgi:hypothetical protein